MAKPQRFLSIKWKAFALTSAFFAALFSALIYGTTFTLQKDFEIRRSKIYLRHEKELQSLTNHTINRIQQIANIIAVANQDINIYQTFASPETADKYNDLWFQLQILVGISSAYLVTANNQLLYSWGNSEHLPLDLVYKANQDERPHSQIGCHKICEIYLAVPFLTKGNHTGAALYSIPFTDTIIDFKQMTDIDIGIIHVEKPNNSSEQNFLPHWNAKIIALTTPATSHPVVQKSSQQYKLQTLTEKPVHFEHSEGIAELFVFNLPGENFDHSGKVILLSDVTNELKLLNNNIFYATSFGVVGLLLSELLLLLILSQPLRKLQQTASYLPLLAKNKFTTAEKALTSLKNQKSLFIDEADTVNDTAIDLANQLKELHNEVQKRTQEIEKERDLITGLLNTAHALMITHNTLGQIALVNHHTLKITGFDEEDLIGRSYCSLLAYDENLPDIRYQLQELIDRKSKEFNHESEIRCKSGDLIHMAWFHTRLPNRDDEHQILTVSLDISERKKAEAHLGWLASHDPLTGLYNRRRFSEELNHALAASHRYNHTGAILFFDLDDFKDINDTSGHHVGDMLLKQIATVLKNCIRESDTIARLGGDEFALLTLESTEEEATQTADRICKSLAKVTVKGENRIHRVSSSIGIVLFPKHGGNIDELLANADIAMYQAKEAGRNGWRMYNEKEYGREYINQKLYWREKVKQVLSDNTIVIFYQPISNVNSGEISHYEALLRVPDDNGNPLPPTDLILSAEKSGLIPELDLKIVEKVLEDHSHLRQLGIQFNVTINLSGLSFHNPNLVDTILNWFEEKQVDPKRVIFEITETAAVADIGMTIKIMEKLKQSGCLFALDDFGVGFSSLYYLKQFPVDFVKIDGSFIRDLHCQPDDQVLVKALVEVARAFRKFTVAEFVECSETLSLLQKLGVNYAQGYHIGKPKPLDEVLEQIKAPRQSHS